LETLAASLPAYARDLARNLVSLEEETLLSEQQKWGCFVASAHALGVAPVVQAIEASAAAAGLSAEAGEAAKGAAAIMAQNNVYFSAVGVMANLDYRSFRTRLRMNIVQRPGVPRGDFDLWCVAVSAINGCADCLDDHEASARRAGVEPAEIQAALRIAAVVNGVSRVLAGEASAQRAAPVST
jgi:alkyl hydroperoxide reductase subunit D